MDKLGSLIGITSSETPAARRSRRAIYCSPPHHGRDGPDGARYCRWFIYPFPIAYLAASFDKPDAGICPVDSLGLSTVKEHSA